MKDQYRIQRDDVLSHLRFNLTYRTTSKAEDEPVCLASLLGLDVRSILETPTHLRMSQLFREMVLLPSSVPLAPGPRIREPAMGWARQPFLQGSRGREYALALMMSRHFGTQRFTPRSTAIVSRHGLLVKMRSWGIVEKQRLGRGSVVAHGLILHDTSASSTTQTLYLKLADVSENVREAGEVNIDFSNKQFSILRFDNRYADQETSLSERGFEYGVLVSHRLADMSSTRDRIDQLALKATYRSRVLLRRAA